MKDDIFIHVGSNGDISLECSLCPQTHPYVNKDCRMATRNEEVSECLLREKKFVGCKNCRRGAVIYLAPGVVYKMEFLQLIVKVYCDWYSHQNYIKDSFDWTYECTQERIKFSAV